MQAIRRRRSATRRARGWPRTRPTIASSASRAAVDALGGARQRAADLLRVLQRRERLLGGVPHAGGVELRGPARPPSGSGSGRSGRRARARGASSVSLSSVTIILLPSYSCSGSRPDGHLLVGGDDQDREAGVALGERRVERLPGPVLRELLVLRVDRDARLRRARRRRRPRSRCRPSCRRSRSARRRRGGRRRRARRPSASTSSNACCSNARPLPVPRSRSAASSASASRASWRRFTSPSSCASFSISLSCDSPERFTSRTTAALKSASGLWPSSAENWRSRSWRDSLQRLRDELLDLVLHGGAAVAAEVLGDQLGELVGVGVEHLRHRAAVLAEEALELLLEAARRSRARARRTACSASAEARSSSCRIASTSAPVASRSSTRAPISSASGPSRRAAISRSQPALDQLDQRAVLDRRGRRSAPRRRGPLTLAAPGPGVAFLRIEGSHSFHVNSKVALTPDGTEDG